VRVFVITPNLFVEGIDREGFQGSVGPSISTSRPFYLFLSVFLFITEEKDHPHLQAVNGEA
jgi:hypothetical protein